MVKYAVGSASTSGPHAVTAIAPSGRSGYAERTAKAATELDGAALAESAARKATVPGEPVLTSP